MKIRILFISIISALFFFTACEDDQATNEGQVALGFKAVESTSTLKAMDTLVFDKAMIGLKEIEIESEEEAAMEDDTTETEGEEREYEFEGPFQVDLLAGTRLGDLATVEPGIYTEMEAEIAPVLDNNYSIHIEGDYTNTNNESYRLIYHTSESFEFEVENEQGIQVDNQEVQDLIVRIDLMNLFKSVNLDNAVVDTANRIVISDEQNEELAESIKNYLENASEFEEEEDDDDDEEENDDEDK